MREIVSKVLFILFIVVENKKNIVVTISVFFFLELTFFRQVNHSPAKNISVFCSVEVFMHVVALLMRVTDFGIVKEQGQAQNSLVRFCPGFSLAHLLQKSFQYSIAFRTQPRQHKDRTFPVALIVFLF